MGKHPRKLPFTRENRPCVTAGTQDRTSSHVVGIPDASLRVAAVRGLEVEFGHASGFAERLGRDGSWGARFWGMTARPSRRGGKSGDPMRRAGVRKKATRKKAARKKSGRSNASKKKARKKRAIRKKTGRKKTAKKAVKKRSRAAGKSSRGAAEAGDDLRHTAMHWALRRLGR